VRIRKEDAKIRRERDGVDAQENNGDAKIGKDVRIRKEESDGVDGVVDGEDARIRKEVSDGVDGVVDVARSGGTVTVQSSSTCNNKPFALWKLVKRTKFKTPVLFFKSN
jgi:hypothetical protein